MTYHVIKTVKTCLLCNILIHFGVLASPLARLVVVQQSSNHYTHTHTLLLHLIIGRFWTILLVVIIVWGRSCFDIQNIVATN